MGEYLSHTSHEAQSRFYENHIARSEEMCKLIYRKLQKVYPEDIKCISFSEFYHLCNQINISPIRVKADELSYHIHILIRYELERDLINGIISVDDLPRLWKEKYSAYLRVDITNDIE